MQAIATAWFSGGELTTCRRRTAPTKQENLQEVPRRKRGRGSAEFGARARLSELLVNARCDLLALVLPHGIGGREAALLLQLLDQALLFLELRRGGEEGEGTGQQLL